MKNEIYHEWNRYDREKISQHANEQAQGHVSRSYRSHYGSWGYSHGSCPDNQNSERKIGNRFEKESGKIIGYDGKNNKRREKRRYVNFYVFLFFLQQACVKR